MPPAGGLMVGGSRTVVAQAAREFEHLRIAARGDTLVYTAIPSGQSGSPVAGLPSLSIAIVAIAIPLASTGLQRESEAAARAGDLEAALRAARSAQNAEPWAAGPRLQQALVLESEGDLTAALAAAHGAAERESTNWRNFLVLSRIEAERGEAFAAVQDYRRARSLNPHSELFER